MARRPEWNALLLSLAIACGGATPPPANPTTGELASDQPTEIDMPVETIEGSARYPAAPRLDVADELHGVKVADPYRWLEDEASADTQRWLSDNDALTRAALAELPYREQLAKRFEELYYLDTISPPIKRGGRYFYTRRHKDKEKAIVYWKQGAGGEERVLLDPHAMSEDGSTALTGWYPTYDGKLVAYKINPDNADESIMHVRNVETGADSAVDVIEGVKYSGASWTPKGDGFYYTYLPKGADIPVAERPGYAELRFHAIGTDPATDEVVFGRTGSPQTFLGGGVSRDGRWLVVAVQQGWSSTDVYFKDLKQRARKRKGAAPAPEALAELPLRERIRAEAEARGFVPLVVGKDFVYQVEVWKNTFYVLTNEDAPKYRVFKVDPRRPARDQWKEILPEGDTPIDGVNVVGNHLAVQYVRNAYSDIEIRKLDGRLLRKVELPGIGDAGLGGEPDDDEAYFSFSSFTQPYLIYKTSIKRGKPELWAKVDVPVDTSDVEVEQIWYESKDGTKVPMFLIHKRGIARDGRNATLLYGYGGFNVNMRPYFSSAIVSWVENGGIWATANLRGGGEFGEDWHKAGMLLNKQNVFDDFIAAAEYLIRERYTSPDKLAIRGGSNGGLLVGAAMTQRPELFRAVICAVPLLDMVRYHLFGSGKTWITEYGSADDPDQFRVLYGYSPYHHVKEGVEYPSLLMMASDHDDRVDQMHARKFTAAVQWAAKGDRPHFIRVERNAGHTGADLVRQTVQSYADQFAFLMWQLGMK